MNILEPVSEDSGLRKTQRIARESGLYQLSCRPLHCANVKFSAGPIRLSDPLRSHEGKDLMQLLKEAFEYTIHLERSYPPAAEPHHHELSHLPPAVDLSWAQILAANQGKITSLSQWQDVVDFQIKPTLERAYEVLYKSDMLWWVSKYKPAIKRLLERHTWLLEQQQSPLYSKIKDSVDQMFPATQHLTLPQQALLFPCLDEFVDTTIVSIRQSPHLADLPLVLQEANKRKTM